MRLRALLFFAQPFVFAFLSVIPEGNLLLAGCPILAA